MGEARLVKIDLRPYQEQAVAGLRGAFRDGHRAPLLVLPTGGGKTFVFCYIARQAVERGRKVLVLVHRQELLMQSSRSLDFLEVEHGLIAPQHTPTTDDVQVASVQTLVRRLDKVRWGPPDIVIVDEAHHAVAGSWRKILDHFSDSMTIGVTATPARLDGQGLGVKVGGVFDRMVQGPSIAELTEQGFLAPAKVYAPPMVADLDGVKKAAGDFQKKDVAKRMDKSTITGDAVGHYARLAPGRPAIVFCVTVAHAEHVAEQFRASGFRAASLDGSLPDDERKQRIDDLSSGRLQVLTSCEIVSEGFDLPVCEVAILLRPTTSTALYLQQVGRVLRPAPGKEHAVILDHVGNVRTHGLPDADREWDLDAGKTKRGKKGETGPPVRQCEQCFTCHAPAPECPACGYRYKMDDRTPEQVEGELEEITEAEKAALRHEKKREEASCETLADLERLGKARGYKPGWALKRYEARMRNRGRYARP